MAIPTLTPASTANKSVLPSVGTSANVAATLPYGIYASSDDFLNGAVDQVAYVYKKLGGDVLDVELTEGNVYAAYEEAVLEYSYLVNIHQAKNSLGDSLGNTTASFDEDGQIKLGESLKDKNIELRYPRFTFSHTQRAADGMGTEAAPVAGGDLTVYSASIAVTSSVQDYDLQSMIKTSFDMGDFGFDSDDTIGNRKITVKKVFYVSPRAMWRFFAYYGGLNVIGNMSSYGQFADDSTFEIVPTWQNKLQAINYEDSVKTRISQYSYEIQNNKLVIYPAPDGNYPKKLWIKFTVQRDAWDEHGDRSKGHDGVNNMNTLPYANIPYDRINSIGKQWIRRFALALCKEMLGHIRSKFGGIPLPGGTVTLDGATMVTEGKTEQKELRDELKTVLDELTYAKLVERDANMTDNATKALTKVPIPIFIW